MERQRGATKLEFAVAALLFAVAVGTLLHALRYRQEEAEKLTVDLTVMAMRTGLMAEIADRLIKRSGTDAADLVGANPVRWLQAPPPGYMGEFKEADPRFMQPGSWYFNQKTGEMVYKLHSASFFRRLDGGEGQEIRWRAQARSGKKEKVAVDEMALLPTVAYEWFE